MTEPVIITIITSVFGVITASIAGFYSVKVKKLETAKEQKDRSISRLKAELTCINVLFDYNMISLINEKVDYLFRHTSAERFIILFALNGKTDFNFVSVCYEKTKTEGTRGSIYRYVRLKIDEHYRQMLKHVEKEESIYLSVPEMPPCLLKDIYESIVEGVTFSSIHFIARNQLDSDNDVLVYSSLATTQDKNFTPSEKVIIKSTYDELRAHAHQINFDAKHKEHEL